jgi:hypothetical protein
MSYAKCRKKEAEIKNIEMKNVEIIENRVSY